MHVYLNIQRERERERVAIILVELVRKKLVEIRILKRLEGRRGSAVSQIFANFQLSVLQMRQGIFLKNRFYDVFVRQMWER